MKQVVRAFFFFAYSIAFSLFPSGNAEATSVIFLPGPGGAGSGISSTTSSSFSTHFNTGVDFQGSLESFTDLSSGRFSLTGVQGSFNPSATGNVNQYTQGGNFSLYNASNQLLLSGVLGLGSLTANTGGESIYSDQLLITGGLFDHYFSATPRSIQLDFAGLPTASYQDQTTYQNVFTGQYQQHLTGYQTVQTGTTQTLTGYTNGRLQCLDYHGFAGHGCVPVDGNGYILPQYIGKWLLLGSTPTPTRVYDQVPVYTNTPVYAQVPVYEQVPIYTQQATVHHVFGGWDWDTQFVRGLILSGSDCGCSTAPVPEPATCALLGLGALPLLRRRRKSVLA